MPQDPLGSGEPRTQKEARMTEANKELVRRWAEVFNGHSADVCEEIIAPTYVEHAVAPFGRVAPGAVAGPKHIRETALWLREQFPDMHFTIEAIVADDDTVACRVLSTGTNLGSLNRVLPPTGKRFEAAQTHWFRVEDNRLREHWAIRDDLTAMIQLGVISPPGSRPDMH
jgi:predicted ester cyclase